MWYSRISRFFRVNRVRSVSRGFGFDVAHVIGLYRVLHQLSVFTGSLESEVCEMVFVFVCFRGQWSPIPIPIRHAWTTIYNLDQGIVSWFVDRLFAPIHCLYVCVCVVQIKHLRRPVDHDVTCCVAPLKLETPLQSEGHLSHALPFILH